MIKHFAKTKLLLAAASFACSVYGQELPPVTLPANTQLCENQPWKLVMYDDFSGTSLNSELWSPYNTTWGVDHHSDNWGDGRIPYPDNYSIIRDENVVVSGGRVKLKSIQKSGSWACDTCIHYDEIKNPYVQSRPYYANFTTGYISSKQYFSSGRVEARLKMPIFPHSWNTCWFWAVGGIDEIDFAESKSPIGYPVAVPFPDLLDKLRPSVTYSVHAWAPPLDNNPFSLAHEWQTEWYPGQSAWNWATFNRFRYEDMHTYQCDWDSTRVSFYVDGNHTKTYYKYTETVTIPLYPGYPPGYGPTISVQVPVTNCILPNTKTLKILKGFPYNKRSTARLIFSTGVTSREKILSNFEDLPLGQMEIEYVKVFQRRPEEDNNVNLCSPPSIGISGPSIFCPGAAYTLPAGVSGGQWSVFYGDMFNTPLTGSNTVMPSLNVNSSSYTAHLVYNYMVPGCPYPFTVGKQIYTGVSTQANTRAICTRSLYPASQNFTFHIQNPNPHFQYNWSVSIQFLDLPGTVTYTGVGSSFTTPFIPHTQRRYKATWTLNVNSAVCGDAKTFTGSSIRFLNEYATLELPVWTEHATFMAKDSSAFYFEAQFSASDSAKYGNALIAALENKVLNSPEDTQRVDSLIQRVKTDLLVDYLKFGDIKDGGSMPMLAKMQIKETENKSSVFPNPAENYLSVQLSKAFDQNVSTIYQIINYAGEIVAQGTLSTTINLETLSAGIYTVVLQQGTVEEICKFIKQ